MTSHELTAAASRFSDRDFDYMITSLLEARAERDALEPAEYGSTAPSAAEAWAQLVAASPALASETAKELYENYFVMTRELARGDL